MNGIGYAGLAKFPLFQFGVSYILSTHCNSNRALALAMDSPPMVVLRDVSLSGRHNLFGVEVLLRSASRQARSVSEFSLIGELLHKKTSGPQALRARKRSGAGPKASLTLLNNPRILMRTYNPIRVRTICAVLLFSMFSVAPPAALALPFDTALPWPERMAVNGAAAFDFDADGDEDVLLVGDLGFQLWRNNGSGGFAQAFSRTAPAAKAVQAGDLDGDGDIDAWVLNDNGMSLYSNENGEDLTDLDWGNLPEGWRSALPLCHALDLGDLNGDSRPDAWLLCADGIHLLFNQGQGEFLSSDQDFGTFAPVPDGEAPPADFPMHVKLADLDGDNDLDAWVTEAGASRIWLNDGTGVFSEGQRVASGAYGADVAFGDLNGDLLPDAVVGNNGANLVFLNTGGAVFQDTQQRLGGDDTVAVLMEDYDSDGDLDAWIANASTDNQLWINQGNGSLVQGPDNPGMGLFEKSEAGLGDGLATQALSSDLNGDGKPDVLLTNADSPSGVWINPNDGQFEQFKIFVNDRLQLAEVADLDGDGDLDLVAISGSDPVRVWLNDHGEFVSHGGSIGAGAATAVALGNIDGNSGIDIAVADSYGVRIFLNNGDATFTPIQITYDLDNEAFVLCGNPETDFCVDQLLGEGGARGLALGDLNNDSTLDLWVTHLNQPDRVWLNQGGGLFSNNGQQLGTETATNVALGDLDGDGDRDAWLTSTDYSGRIWRNDGAGLFYPDPYPMGTSATLAVDLIDLNQDGLLDAWLTQQGGAPAELWINQGGGLFEQTDQTLGSGFAGNAAFADFDIDGDLDSLIPNGSGGSSLWVNDGAGYFFEFQARFNSIPSSVAAAGDFNLDGMPDVLLGAPGFPTQSLTNRRFIGPATGQFYQSPESPITPYINDIAIADFTGDGLNDVLLGTNGADLIWSNSRLSGFADSGQRLGSSDTRTVAAKDLDQDGDIDVVTGSFYEPNLVWRNNGSGTFTQIGQFGEGAVTTTGIGLADVDLNGSMDIVTTNSQDPAYVWTNTGGGSFLASQQLLHYELDVGVDVELADLDSDGAPDIWLATHEASSLIWLNDGNGSFFSGPQIDPFARNLGVALGDLNGDSAVDAWVTNEGADAVWLNNGAGSFVKSSINLPGGVKGEIALADTDIDGDLDAWVIEADGYPHLYLNNGLAGFTESGQAIGTAGSAELLGVGDLNGDLNPDLWVFNGDGSNEIWLNESGGLIVDVNERLELSEAGEEVTFSVSLQMNPMEPIEVRMSNGNPSQVQLSTTSLLFDQTNWNIPQPVTLLGLQDTIVDGDQHSLIILYPLATSNPFFSDLDPNDIAVLVLDDDDDDKDGLPDLYEVEIGLDPNDPADALLDVDEDGLTALEEYAISTSPFRADSDGDGLSDGIDPDPLYGTSCVSGNPVVSLRDASLSGNVSCSASSTISTSGALSIAGNAYGIWSAPVISLSPGFSITAGAGVRFTTD